MDRTRLASLLVALWALLNAYFLTLIGYTPTARPLGWCIFAIALVLAAALWLRKRWARPVVLLLAAALLCCYAVVLVRDGTAPCTPAEVRCQIEVLANPFLALAAFVVLISQWSLTTRWSGRDCE
jgi:hypothetical protein